MPVKLARLLDLKRSLQVGRFNTDAHSGNIHQLPELLARIRVSSSHDPRQLSYCRYTPLSGRGTCCIAELCLQSAVRALPLVPLIAPFQNRRVLLCKYWELSPVSDRVTTFNTAAGNGKTCTLKLISGRIGAEFGSEGQLVWYLGLS